MNPYRVVIVGGGISGLAVAYYLTALSKERRLPLALQLLEASDRLGGVIATEERDGFLLEHGPDAFLKEPAWGLELACSLGLREKLIETQQDCQKTFIVRNQQLVPLPHGFYLVAPSNISALLSSPLFSVQGKLRMMLEPFIPPRQSRADESVAGFVKRRFGKEVFHRVGQAVISGIYSGDPEHLSVRATMPQLVQWEKEYGSITKALWHRRRGRKKEAQQAAENRSGLFVSFDGGMQTLINALIQQLPPATARLNTTVQHITYDRTQQCWAIACTGDAPRLADAVCVALRPQLAAKLVSEAHAPLAQALAGIPSASGVTINAAYRRSDIRHPLDGFGFVAPPSPTRIVTACTFSSVKFARRAPQGRVLLRAFVGEAFHPELLALDDSKLAQLVIQELQTLLGINASPLFTTCTRHQQAFPLYQLRHHELLNHIEEYLTQLEGFALAGNSYRGVGIPHCLRSARDAAHQLLQRPVFPVTN